MHELVPSDLKTKLLGRLRRFSFAGDGLPERMRSTAFAFLGLTAAAGLALVAIFAQPGFPLLSPAPLPSEPAAESAVAKAVALDPRGRAFEHPSPGVARPGTREPGRRSRDSSGNSSEQGAEPTAPAPATPTAADPGEGTSGSVPVETPAPMAAPAPAPLPSSEPAPATANDPAPAAKPPPVPERSATPTPPPAPGNSQSSAAAAHASERGVEASSKSVPEATVSGVATSPDASPGNGNGKALGHDK